jgi:serine/threonine protein kinase
MHLLQIVHLDIKPPNIMFSNSLNKFLLIDFGLSKFVEQKIGFKTFT